MADLDEHTVSQGYTHMLTGIGLRNFKAFGDEMQEAPLSKITLIYGPNSGGKSSIIQALLLLKQSLKSQYYKPAKSDQRELVLNGELTDLNSIQSLLHKHENKRSLDISVRFKNLRLGGMAENCVAMSFVDDHGSAHMSEVCYKIVSNRNEKSLLSVAIGMGARAGIASSDKDPFHPYHERNEAQFKISEVSGYKASHLDFSEFLPTLFFPELARVRQAKLEGRPLSEQKIGELKEIVGAQDENVSALLAAFDRANRWAVDEEVEKVLGQLELSPDEILMLTPENIPQSYESLLRSVNYLGPLRSAPQRLYRHSNETDSFIDVTGSQGEFSANVLYGGSLVGTTLQWKVKDAVNHWFEQFDIPYELDVIPLGEASLAGEYITIALTDKRTNTQVTLADVGYGINQILPVIIEGIASWDGSILCVEQPEIHLHPRLQANIADLMIDTIAYEGGKRKQWIVETHSELLITRLQRRIREGKIKPEDISVLYVDPSDDNGVEGSAIKVLRLGEDSYFKDHWPHGFFNEALNEELHPNDELNSSAEGVDVLDELFAE